VVLFQDDFETATSNWQVSADPANPGAYWQRVKDGSNTVYSGQGYVSLNLVGRQWTDFRFSSRIKLLDGAVSMNYRTGACSRYFLNFNTQSSRLGKQPTDCTFSEYDFLAPPQLSLWKQWNDPDILMNQSVVSVATSDPGIAPLAVVHAATLRSGAPLAPDAIATIYGTGLAGPVISGTRVIASDRFGSEADASLLYVSPGQINLVLPPGLAPGVAVLKVTRDGQPAGAAGIVLAPVAPGLFTAGGTETGPAAAMVVSVGADGSQTVSAAFTCRTVGDCRTAPISLQAGAARSYLVLYGTGIRGASNAKVMVTIGGVAVPVVSAGAQSQFAGLDQVNFELPASLAGIGEVPVQLSADGLAANTVSINLR
jgi:uncharacterized protein (TIGR03437 family)